MGHPLVLPLKKRSLSRHFLLQAPQCSCSVRKSRDYCSEEGHNLVAGLWGRTLLHLGAGYKYSYLLTYTRWELTTWADFQFRLLMTVGSKSRHSAFLDVNHCNSIESIQLTSCVCLKPVNKVVIKLTLNPSLLLRHWVKSAFMSIIETRSCGLFGPEQHGTTVLRSNSCTCKVNLDLYSASMRTCL